MLVIRLFRVGKKNQPSFKIVVTDKKNPPRGGEFVEEVGFYNPIKKEKILKGERLKYWLSVGAKPSATVFNMLIAEKIIEDKKIPKHKKPRPQEGEDRLTELAGKKPEEQKVAAPTAPAPVTLAPETPTEVKPVPETPAEAKPAQ